MERDAQGRSFRRNGTTYCIGVWSFRVLQKVTLRITRYIIKLLFREKLFFHSKKFYLVNWPPKVRQLHWLSTRGWVLRSTGLNSLMWICMQINTGADNIVHSYPSACFSSPKFPLVFSTLGLRCRRWLPWQQFSSLNLSPLLLLLIFQVPQIFLVIARRSMVSFNELIWYLAILNKIE